MRKIILIITVLMALCGCQERRESLYDGPDPNIIEELTEEIQEDAEEETGEEETVEEAEPDENIIRPDVKEAIDAYEEFVDEYLAFMKKYDESDGTDMSLLIDYMSFMAKLEEYTDKMENMEDDLTVAESIYYYEVINRCNEKIIKAMDY